MASSAGVLFALAVITVVAVSLPELVSGYRIWLNQSNRTSISSPQTISGSKRFEGSSSYVRMQYHMGPVLSSGIRVYLIWYGGWKPAQKSAIRDFVRSVSSASAPSPSISQWWKTVQLYADQTGANVSKKLELAGEHHDRHYSHGKLLTRLSVQEVIKAALSKTLKPGSSGNLTAATLRGKLPADPGRGLYYVLTSDDVVMQDFCRAVCGFHYFTFPSIAGYTLPYAWVGNSGKQCPHLCAYPFAVPAYMTGMVALKPPNGDVGVDGMISVMAHELAEISSNPLINAWYAGDNPMAPTEIADLCEGIYGSGGGGSYMGQVQEDVVGASFNLHGVRGRRYMVQWIWNPNLGYCTGPNALDG